MGHPAGRHRFIVGGWSKRSKELPTLCTKQNRKGYATRSRLSLLRMRHAPTRKGGVWVPRYDGSVVLY
jgi:hypothetical protein